LRILIVTTYFPPLNSIASLRSYSWAKYWHEAGHYVTVLTTTKYKEPSSDLPVINPGFQLIEVPMPSFVYLLKKDYKTSKNPKAHKKKFFGSLRKHLHNFFHYIREKKGIFNACRMPDFTDLWINPAYKSLRKGDAWDLVISTYAPYAAHLLAYKIKKNGKAKKWIADFRDAWVDNDIYPGIFPLNYIEKLLESYCMRKADLITTVSEPYAKSFYQKYGKNKVKIIENGFDREDLSNLDSAPIFSNDGKFRIVYTGSIYTDKRDPLPLFESIKELSQNPENEPFLDRLEVIFAGPPNVRVQSFIQELDISKWVKIIGMLPREAALKMQRDANYLLFLPWTDLGVDGVLTGKLFEYLSSKTPIIAVGGKGLEASQKLILDNNAGLVLNTREDIKAFLMKNLKNVDTKKFQIDSKFLDQYDRKALALKLLQLIQ
jgi:glycosyltransferase involved in cell wall biosynthesis